MNAKVIDIASTEALQKNLEARVRRWKKEAVTMWQKLSFIKQLLAVRGHRIYVRDEQLQKDVAGNPETSLYLRWCDRDGPYINYPHGKGKVHCPLCETRRLEKLPAAPIAA